MRMRQATAAATLLPEIIRSHRKGRPRAVMAACTASPFAIRAVLQQTCQDGAVALIESTASQVNPDGGYAGLTPAVFHRQVAQLAVAAGLPPDRLLLGGDHIGPYPWSNGRAARALAKAAELAAACVAAGYHKIHLDAAPPCRDDPREPDGSLPLALICRRSADLCRATEEAAREAGTAPPWYVIGSDVPPPGGRSCLADAAPVSSARQVREFVARCRKAFYRAGLADAWERVLGVVVHTGADFSATAVQPYDTDRMQPLSRYLRQEDHLVFEAHSTDFQKPAALARMVMDGCGILKVGPALTYAMREALFGLAAVEKEMLGGRKGIRLSRLPETMERLMRADPRYWRAYYQGPAAEQKRLRRCALSDRIRYYWFRPEAEAALQRLLANLRRYPPPPSLLNEHLPGTARQFPPKPAVRDPEQIVVERIAAVAAAYHKACGPFPA